MVIRISDFFSAHERLLIKAADTLPIKCLTSEDKKDRTKPVQGNG